MRGSKDRFAVLCGRGDWFIYDRINSRFFNETNPVLSWWYSEVNATPYESREAAEAALAVARITGAIHG